MLVNISPSALCRFLHASRFTRQRLQITASQRDLLLRQQFVTDVSLYSPEMLVFLLMKQKECTTKVWVQHQGKTFEKL